MKKVIAYDLGTGGVKASVHDESGRVLRKTITEYRTYYPADGWHEQRPEDWWSAVASSTKSLMEGFDPGEVVCLALSGQSLVAAPIGESGELLADSVPIWSDTRPREQVSAFFDRVEHDDFYEITGNGFPAPCYSIFKLMWLKQHKPDIYTRIYKVLGSKDYINYRLTGKMAIDRSYASGTGAFDLLTGTMNQKILNAAGISPDIFPSIHAPHAVLGNLAPEAARALGLNQNTLVACGGVDNACMALGAVGAGGGGVYTSLGSSAWIAANSEKPILDRIKKPYVFAHIEKGMFTSAFSIFSGGSSLRWLRDTLCPDFAGDGAYLKMDAFAGESPIGSRGVLFNPSLAGGTSQDRSIHIRGGFAGLSLGTGRADMIRAAMEGIAFNLRMSLESLRGQVNLSNTMLFCGGGSKSLFWMQMFADIFNMKIRKTNIDQDAASMGAAAIALRAAGIWRDYGAIEGLHTIEHEYEPIQANAEAYIKPGKLFEVYNSMAAELGERSYKLYGGAF